MSGLVLKEEGYAVLGACMEVYKAKGCGFLEAVYQECVEIELKERQIPFIAKPRLTLRYRDRPLQTCYEPDLVCYDRIIVELKSVSKLAEEHRAQVLNYLCASGAALGLLVNFGHYPGLQYRRIANTTGRRLATTRKNSPANLSRI